jgi:hypothetical protein
MRNKGSRTIQVSPVDDEPKGRQVIDMPERGRIEALFDQNLFRMHIRRERSSAYWFAASIWGVGGLVIGAMLGGYMMFQAYVGLTAPVRDTLVQGQVIRAATDSVNSRPSLVDPDRPADPNAPQH